MGEGSRVWGDSRNPFHILLAATDGVYFRLLPSKPVMKRLGKSCHAAALNKHPNRQPEAEGADGSLIILCGQVMTASRRKNKEKHSKVWESNVSTKSMASWKRGCMQQLWDRL